LSFEQALSQLEALVRKMETGDAALEDSIAYYERGVALKSHCGKKLKDAELRVEVIMCSADKTLTVQPLDNRE